MVALTQSLIFAHAALAEELSVLEVCDRNTSHERKRITAKVTNTLRTVLFRGADEVPSEGDLPRAACTLRTVLLRGAGEVV